MDRLKNHDALRVRVLKIFETQKINDFLIVPFLTKLDEQKK